MDTIKIGIVGIGNCASSLVQGIYYYRDKQRDDAIGLMHWEIGGYKPGDIDVVAAFDVDARKVGRDVSEAIFALPNCTTVFCDSVPKTGTKVRMGKLLDGVSDHMKDYDDKYTFIVADEPEPSKEEVVQAIKDSGAEILLNYLPVGSEEAVRFYAECALEAGVALVNNMPVFIASDPAWAERFREKNLPIIGDDIKAQLGATITHRTLTYLFKKRGVLLDRTYQLNTGGNTDFLNMLNHTRLSSKRTSKTEAVQSVAAHRLDPENIHIGPSDWVPWQKDNKVCFLRMEGKLFGDVPMDVEMRLSVEDSPNSAGIVIDAIRCCKLALNRGQGGILYAPSSYFMKHPPKQYNDDDAYTMTEAFIANSADGNKRPWGYYTILADEDDHKVKRIVLMPGQRLSLQKHERRAEHWQVIQGEALVSVNGREVSLKAGQSVDIPQGTPHRIKNTGDGDLAFIEVQSGDYFGEDDIVRLEDDYGRS